MATGRGAVRVYVPDWLEDALPVATRPPSLDGITDPQPASASAANAGASLRRDTQWFIPKDIYGSEVNAAGKSSVNQR